MNICLTSTTCRLPFDADVSRQAALTHVGYSPSPNSQRRLTLDTHLSKQAALNSVRYQPLPNSQRWLTLDTYRCKTVSFSVFAHSPWQNSQRWLVSATEDILQMAGSILKACRAARRPEEGKGPGQRPPQI